MALLVISNDIQVTQPGSCGVEPASSVEAVLGHVGTLALEDTAASTTDTTPGSVDHRPLLLALVYGLCHH